jgi:hypothetical protein
MQEAIFGVRAESPIVREAVEAEGDAFTLPDEDEEVEELDRAIDAPEEEDDDIPRRYVPPVEELGNEPAAEDEALQAIQQSQALQQVLDYLLRLSPDERSQVLQQPQVKAVLRDEPQLFRVLRQVLGPWLDYALQDE